MDAIASSPPSVPAYLPELPGRHGGAAVAPAPPDPMEATPGLSTDPVAAAIDIRNLQAIYTADAQLAAHSQQMFGNLINLLDTEPVGE
jgi:hypothetical protein